VVDELREVFESLGQAEAVFVVSVEVRELDCEFQQNAIDPLLDLDGVLNLSLLGCHAAEHHHCGFLVEAFANFDHLVVSEVVEAEGGHSGAYDVVGPLVCGDGLDFTDLSERGSTLYLFSEAFASLRLTTMQSELFKEMPPRYQTLVFPYPISISAAVLSALSFRDLQLPKMPLILSSLLTLMVSCVAMGKGRRLSSVV
jgi:hypothetical protein